MTNKKEEGITDPFDTLANPEYSRFIHKSRYARWLEKEGRRENWGETVDRYIGFFRGRFPDVGSIPWEELRSAIYNLEIMPSMRAFMTAGRALERDEMASFNCAYLAVNDLRCFDEIMYVLMCGTGVGFSVERQAITNLPTVAEKLYPTDTPIIPRDSKIGWASSYRELIAMLYAGSIPKWDFSKIRPAGAKLKTFGGRASGPGPLDDLFKFTIEVFKGAVGRKLTSIECHDLVCKIAEIVVVGGVRRSALISLSNMSDDRMREAKSGAWWEQNVQRALANNSVCYTDKPDLMGFMKESLSLYQSKSGERGIYNRKAAWELAPERRRALGEYELGCNPCSEITLRSAETCNLSEVIVRPGDTLKDLQRKTALATVLGTLQASLTKFRYVRKVWQRNCEEEALLGVSLTGIMDHSVMSGGPVDPSKEEDLISWLEALKTTAIESNRKWAEEIGINPAAAITCVKPSGTVSQLVDSASGIHPRYSEYYNRTVRSDMKDPLAQLMVESGCKYEPDVTKPDNTYVFSFPVASPKDSVFRDDRTALEQLELWKIYQLHWCEHKPSITVYVKEDEWMGVFAWVWDNFNILSGVSFLPHTDHNYKQAPYQEITEVEYRSEVAEEARIAWDRLPEFEKSDHTTAMKELACSGGACEIL